MLWRRPRFVSLQLFDLTRAACNFKRGDSLCANWWRGILFKGRSGTCGRRSSLLESSSATGSFVAAQRHLREALKELRGSRAERVGAILARHTGEVSKEDAAKAQIELNELLENRPLAQDPAGKRFLNVLVVGALVPRTSLSRLT